MSELGLGLIYRDVWINVNMIHDLFIVLDDYWPRNAGVGPPVYINVPSVVRSWLALLLSRNDFFDHLVSTAFHLSSHSLKSCRSPDDSFTRTRKR